MSECELLYDCPFYNSYYLEESVPPANFREEYCHNNYVWYGRYIIFKRIEADKKLMEESMVIVSESKDKHEGQRLAHVIKPATYCINQDIIQTPDPKQCYSSTKRKLILLFHLWNILSLIHDIVNTNRHSP